VTGGSLAGGWWSVTRWLAQLPQFRGVNLVESMV
jgi:hypothetical protein